MCDHLGYVGTQPHICSNVLQGSADLVNYAVYASTKSALCHNDLFRCWYDLSWRSDVFVCSCSLATDLLRTVMCLLDDTKRFYPHAVDSVHRLNDSLNISAQANAKRILPLELLVRQLQYLQLRWEMLAVRALVNSLMVGPQASQAHASRKAVSQSILGHVCINLVPRANSSTIFKMADRPEKAGRMYLHVKRALCESRANEAWSRCQTFPSWSWDSFWSSAAALVPRAHVSLVSAKIRSSGIINFQTPRF